MPHNNSEYSKDWFERGSADLNTVEILLAHDGDISTAAMHIQQAAEKYLKGYLISKGWKLKRTHDLVELLDHAIEHNTDLEKYRDFCEKVTVFYFASRYPIFEKHPSKGEVEDALKTVKEMIQFIDSGTEKISDDADRENGKMDSEGHPNEK